MDFMPPDASSLPEYNLDSNATWKEVEDILRPLAMKLVFSAHIFYWRGQEEEIIDDVVQEALQRTWQKAQQMQRGDASPIHSIKHLAIVILQHYIMDLIRHDQRQLQKFSGGRFSEAELSEVIDTSENDPLEIVTEDMFRDELFNELADEVAHFPQKQKIALLTDLASHTAFSDEPTSLQRAFLKYEMKLEDYRGLRPTNKIERARYASLLSIAYKRLAKVSRLS